MLDTPFVNCYYSFAMKQSVEFPRNLFAILSRDTARRHKCDLSTAPRKEKLLLCPSPKRAPNRPLVCAIR